MHNDGFNRAMERYGYDKSVKKHLQLGTITPSDEGLISRFIAARKIEHNITDTRARSLGVILISCRRFIRKPYDELTIDDIYAGVASMKVGRREDGRPYKTNTVRENVRVLKSFLTWLASEKILDLPENKLKKIQSPQADFDTEKSEDLLSEDEVVSLIKACTSSRDRALIWTTYEATARISEMGRVTLKDLRFEPDMITIRIEDEKTHRERGAHIVKGIPYLTAYLNDRGDVPQSDFLFKLYGDRPLTYDGTRKMLELVTKRSSIKKRVHWHILRKSRITNMISEGYQESYVREVAWANQGTVMFKPYLKLSDKVLATEARRMAGIETEEVLKKVEPRRVKCRCGHINEPSAKYCSNCTRPLTAEAMGSSMSMQDMIKEMFKDPEFKREVLEELEK